MTDRLVRFGVAMESSLLEQFDELVESRGSTRSEALRDLARADVTRAQVRRGVEAVGTLTLIYDHHVRDLTERLNELQHSLGDKIRSTLHIHLDHDHCLEIVVMHGRSDVLQSEADRILALKGVLHGALEIYAHGPHAADTHSHTHTHGGHSHAHAHSHDGHTHAHSHDAHTHTRAATSKAKPRSKPVASKARARKK